MVSDKDQKIWKGKIIFKAISVPYFLALSELPTFIVSFYYYKARHIFCSEAILEVDF